MTLLRRARAIVVRLWHRVPRYGFVVAAVAYALYQVGPVAKHERCESSNKSRAAIRYAFQDQYDSYVRIVPDSYRDGARVYRDKRMAKLRRGIGPQDCSKVGRWWDW